LFLFRESELLGTTAAHTGCALPLKAVLFKERVAANFILLATEATKTILRLALLLGEFEVSIIIVDEGIWKSSAGCLL